MENPSYTNENIERKSVFQGKVQSFRIRKIFYRIKNKELKDRKRKREIEELFFKPIIVSVDNMDKFEQK